MISTQIEWLFVLQNTLIGFALGSFFNVLIFRIPANISLWHPPSTCPSCQHKIRLRDNIPVLSWIMLRAKCFYCLKPIPIQYPLVELTTGLLGFLLSLIYIQGFTGIDINQFAAMYFFVLIGLPIIILDLRHYILPDFINYMGIAFGLLLGVLPGGLPLSESLIGAAASFTLLFFIRWLATLILKKEAMGLGDLKFLAMIGALFGFKTAILSLVAASLIGSIVSIPIVLYLKIMALKKHLRQPGQNEITNTAPIIPFGPFLWLAGLISFAAGEPILNVYYRYLGL